MCHNREHREAERRLKHFSANYDGYVKIDWCPQLCRRPLEGNHPIGFVRPVALESAITLILLRPKKKEAQSEVGYKDVILFLLFIILGILKILVQIEEIFL